LPLVQHQRLFELLVREQSMQPVLTKSGPAQPRIGDEFVDEPIALPTKPWKKLLPYAAVAAVTLGLAALAYKIGQSSSPSEFTNPSAAGVLAGPDAILPPWTERKFVTEGGFVRVVGFGRAANERDAQAAARIDAVERLVTELGESLGSSRYAGLLRSRSGERSASAKEAVVKQFAAAHGDVASPERTEAFMVQNGDAVEFFGQYSLPLAAYEGLKKAYEVESDYAGLTVVNLFPGLSSAVPDNAGLVIARVAPGSLAARGGLREGDVIVAIDGKPVPNVAAFKAIKGDLFYQRGEPHIVSITVDLDGTRRELWMRRPRE
jgi:hypothetical protein